MFWYEVSKVNYYIKLVIDYNLSVRQLREKIKNNEYERLPKNTKHKLVLKEKIEVKGLVKNPVIVKNGSNLIFFSFTLIFIMVKYYIE